MVTRGHSTYGLNCINTPQKCRERTLPSWSCALNLVACFPGQAGLAIGLRVGTPVPCTSDPVPPHRSRSIPGDLGKR